MKQLTPLNKLKEWILDDTFSGMIDFVDTDKVLNKLEELLKEEQSVIELAYEDCLINRLLQKDMIDGEQYFKSKFKTK